ncbi:MULTISPECIES: hypothetical protein [Bradyrhizobium]|uniref:hypothetical protein n=1 Tax=Bradyrhizobium TaxID=374 RepID=UPI001FCBC6A4|nr:MULTISPECIES: hypothetical protein [unclassified Bradyrhizobium]
MGGLDKMYRLHKWFGIAALVDAAKIETRTVATQLEFDLGFTEHLDGIFNSIDCEGQDVAAFIGDPAIDWSRRSTVVAADSRCGS